METVSTFLPMLLKLDGVAAVVLAVDGDRVDVPVDSLVVDVLVDVGVDEPRRFRRGICPKYSRDALDVLRLRNFSFSRRKLFQKK